MKKNQYHTTDWQPELPDIRESLTPVPNQMKKRICIDAGHGLGNRKPNVYDPGACFGDHQEATIALTWAHELTEALNSLGLLVTMTRSDKHSKAPLSWRTRMAKDAGCDLFVSLHLNASNGQGHGTETFYRHSSSKVIARRSNDALVKVLGTRDRGIKTEKDSARKTIHVLGFEPDSILIELGFIDHAGDLAKLLDPVKMRLACQALAKALTE
jgi:N-acetylmuramoyl-L-alanine amidase